MDLYLSGIDIKVRRGWSKPDGVVIAVIDHRNGHPVILNDQIGRRDASQPTSWRQSPRVPVKEIEEIEQNDNSYKYRAPALRNVLCIWNIRVKHYSSRHSVVDMPRAAPARSNQLRYRSPISEITSIYMPCGGGLLCSYKDSERRQQFNTAGSDRLFITMPGLVSKSWR